MIRPTVEELYTLAQQARNTIGHQCDLDQSALDFLFPVNGTRTPASHEIRKHICKVASNKQIMSYRAMGLLLGQGRDEWVQRKLFIIDGLLSTRADLKEIKHKLRTSGLPPQTSSHQDT